MVKLFLVVFFFFFYPSQSLFLSFNSSILPSFSAYNPPNPSSSAASSQPLKTFLKEVLNEVAAKKHWDPEANPRVLSVETESTRVGAIESFEFHLRVGGTTLILMFSEETEAWRKADKGEVEFGPDLAGLDVGSRQGIRKLSLEGPLELLANGGDDVLSVHLSSLNITHQGLRRVLVGKGITIEVYSSDEVSLFYPYDIGFLLNERSSKQKQSRGQFWPLGLSSCAPLVSVRVVGPASLVAYMVPDEKAYVETSVPAPYTIELLPNKCFSNELYEQVQSVASHTLSSKWAVMERLLNRFLGKTVLHDRSSRLLKTKITSSKLLKFRVEVERNITENDRTWKEVAKWRTRPTVERSWFEIVGRFEGGRDLKPVVARMLSRPLMIVESAAWSHLMSNISFTEFPSIVVPPEALTLDIKW
ncbi:hypothetical protein IEQ34_011713 [Dendrobium chrysotoxum]|uniref:Uncharacterized protein n=1 Tax=Dendrobium chrysotoxum TaxID=161865 RepID=A0AAV7GTM3_DENCH|nr:hypothetical protein IEQ34_011713 [Dendrobium chrysotoxum]